MCQGDSKAGDEAKKAEVYYEHIYIFIYLLMYVYICISCIQEGRQGKEGRIYSNFKVLYSNFIFYIANIPEL